MLLHIFIFDIHSRLLDNSCCGNWIRIVGLAHVDVTLCGFSFCKFLADFYADFGLSFPFVFCASSHSLDGVAGIGSLFSFWNREVWNDVCNLMKFQMNDFFAFPVLASSGIILHLIESLNFDFLRLLVLVFENVVLLSVKTVVDN